MANSEKVILGNIQYVSFLQNEALWQLVEPYLGKDHTTLLITLTMLGNHNNAFETLKGIISKIKAQDQAKARWLVGKLIAQLHKAAMSVSDNDPEQFALLTGEQVKSALHRGATRIRNLAHEAGINPNDYPKEDQKRVQNLLQLRKVLGFEEWSE